MRINVFEIEAILYIYLYQRFVTFVVLFGCDTLATILSFALIPLCRLLDFFSSWVRYSRDAGKTKRVSLARPYRWYQGILFYIRWNSTSLMDQTNSRLG